jgi:hypothetical protein
MADIIPPLKDALKALEEARWDPGVSRQDKLSVEDLAVTLRGRIQFFQADPQNIETIQLFKVEQHSSKIREAIATYDLPAAVSHGMALMDALPGPGQSRRKWPRRR